MDFTVKHFNELTNTELYEILKTRSEIFVVEQECIYQDLDDKDQDALHVFCRNEFGRVTGCLRVFRKDPDMEPGVVRIGRVATLERCCVENCLEKDTAELFCQSIKMFVRKEIYDQGIYAQSTVL